MWQNPQNSVRYLEVLEVDYNDDFLSVFVSNKKVY